MKMVGQAWFFFFVIPFILTSSIPAQAHVTTGFRAFLRASPVRVGDSFLAGQARSWVRFRFRSETVHPRQWEGLSEIEGDQVLSRMLVGTEVETTALSLTRGVQADLRGLDFYSPFFTYSDDAAHALGAGDLAPSFLPPNLQGVLEGYARRGIPGFTGDFFPRGMAYSLHDTTAAEAALWVDVMGSQVPIRGIRSGDRVLTRFAQARDFVPGESGIGAVGNRFLLRRRDPHTLLSMDGDAVSFLRKTGQRGATRFERKVSGAREPYALGPEGSEIVAFTEHVGETGVNALGIARVGDELRLIKWAGLGPDHLRHVSQIPWGGDNGFLIVGIRFSPRQSLADDLLFEVDFLGKRGQLQTEVFKFNNFEPVKPNGF